MSEGHMTSIGRGAAYLMAAKAATFVMMAAHAVVIPRILGPHTMGFYTYWLSIFFILANAFDFGGGAILNRYLPDYLNTNPSAVRPLLLKTSLVKLPVIVLIVSIGTVIFRDEARNFLAIASSAAVFSLSMIVGAIFYAEKRLGILSLLGISRLLIRMLLVLSLYPVFGEWGVLLAVIGSVVFNSSAFAVPALKSLPPEKGPLPKPFKAYLTFGLWLYVGGLFAMMTRWAAVIMAERWIDDLAVVGFLGLGIQIGLFIVEFVSVVGISVFPSLIEFHATSDSRFGRSVELNWRYTNMLLLPMVGGALILVKPAVGILIGAQFLPTADVVQRLLPYVVFLCWASIHRQILYAFEKRNDMLRKPILEFIVFSLLAWRLIPAYGIHGAPISLGAAMLAGYLYALLVSHRLEPISGYIPSVLKPLFAASLMTGTLTFIPRDSVVSLAVCVILGAAVYMAVMWTIGGIDREDLSRIRAVFKKN